MEKGFDRKKFEKINSAAANAGSPPVSAGFDRKKFEEIISGDFLRQEPQAVIHGLLGVIWALLDENATLREQIRLLQAENQALREENAFLRAQVESLQMKVRELESRLNKDSHNSSKPPSSDGLGKPPRNKSLRRSSGRHVGGQPGHQGKTLRMSENPDRVVVHPANKCTGCGKSLEGVLPQKLERRQVFDIPVIKMEVTEHRGEIKVCPCCGNKNRAQFPAEVPASLQYGVGVKSLTALLMNYQIIPYERLCEFFSDIFGHSVSCGTLNNIAGECYEILEDYENAVKEELKASPVVGFDETGMRVEGKLNWLHSASTGELTYYHVHPLRGAEGMKSAGILPGFTGEAVHDGWGSYFVFPCGHALCNAHHLRELIGVIENDTSKWAVEMTCLLLEIKSSVDVAKESGKEKLESDLIKKFENKYEKILSEGYKEYPSIELSEGGKSGKRGKKKKPPSLNLLDRLWYRMEETLAFMYDFRVPFDNNQSERDIRMVKVKQKISGTFRSNEGAKRFCRIRGYISTVRKQGLAVLQSIRDAFLGKPFMPIVNYGAE